ncbi:AraC family transcriptional regulator [Phaeocystidibacter luteus]|uniref:AraC family transcriptional regulator n=1 Tax=Phaeocystidibacter luteus TaxID=911197 RepID=A0A6N6RI52_9FLAO|nr:AraC family transcriptional regulator [Phaeocystidibacter luteus]KAB2814005.1 AraC family transcriptional regulator [Phaeocystidibacter luteus]
MKPSIKTYKSEDFRKEYLNDDPELNRLFEKSIVDFFCLRVEDLIEGVLKPIKPSREESHTIIYITEGSYKTKIGFEEYTVEAGNVLVIQAGTVFSVEHIITKNKGFTCHFHPDLLEGRFGNRSLVSEFEFLEVGHPSVVNVDHHSKGAVDNVFERLVREFRSVDKPNPQIIQSYLYALLSELNVLFGLNSYKERNSFIRIVSKLKSLAHTHAQKNLKVSDFAELMNLSPNHLNKAVKAITTNSASQLIDEVKMIESKYLLYQSDLSISEISFEMGFSDPSYFTRFFKKKEGIAPSEFRKMIEKS